MLLLMRLNLQPPVASEKPRMPYYGYPDISRRVLKKENDEALLLLIL